MQSVDNEIVLWEPKTKEQSPGEVSFFSLVLFNKLVNYLKNKRNWDDFSLFFVRIFIFFGFFVHVGHS